MFTGVGILFLSWTGVAQLNAPVMSGWVGEALSITMLGLTKPFVLEKAFSWSFGDSCGACLGDTCGAFLESRGRSMFVASIRCIISGRSVGLGDLPSGLWDAVGL